MTESKKTTVSENIKDMADIIKENISIGKDNVVEFNEPDKVFEKVLGDKISKEDMSTAINVINDYTAATGLAFGEKAINHMKDNKDCDNLVVTVPVADGVSINHKILRSKTGQIPNQPGKEYVKNGCLNSSVSIKGTKTNSGNMKAVSNYLETMAEDVLLSNK